MDSDASDVCHFLDLPQMKCVRSNVSGKDSHQIPTTVVEFARSNSLAPFVVAPVVAPSKHPRWRNELYRAAEVLF